MRFDYTGRGQSEGRVRCEHCQQLMLGYDKQDPRTWLGGDRLKFCDCAGSVIRDNRPGHLEERRLQAIKEKWQK